MGVDLEGVDGSSSCFNCVTASLIIPLPLEWVNLTRIRIMRVLFKESSSSASSSLEEVSSVPIGAGATAAGGHH